MKWRGHKVKRRRGNKGAGLRAALKGGGLGVGLPRNKRGDRRVRGVTTETFRQISETFLLHFYMFPKLHIKWCGNFSFLH